jgi:hypothetical protein
MARARANPEASLPCRRALLMASALATLATLSLVGALVSGCRSSSPVSMVSGPPLMSAPSPAQAPRGQSPAARTQRECDVCQGVWAKHGLSETAGCNCRTGDAGKRCRDGAECEGQCVLGDIPERTAKDMGGRAYYVGRCSELMTVFGCARFLPKGAATAEPDPGGEPPPVICVD